MLEFDPRGLLETLSHLRRFYYDTAISSNPIRHQQSSIFAAVRPAPQRPAFFSGRFVNGHSSISTGLSFLNNWRVMLA